MLNFLKAHRGLSIVGSIIIIAVAYLVFFRGSSSAQTQYSLAQATKGTLVTSVSGTGQISASDEIDLVPKASGTYVYADQALAGKFVKAGTLIAEIDPTTAQQALRTAQLDLQSAQLALAKLQANQQTAGTVNSNSLTNAQIALNTAYQDGFNDVATDFTHLPTLVNDARLVLYGTQLASYGCQPDYCAYDNLITVSQRVALDPQITNALNDFATASISYNQALNLYTNTKYNANTAEVEPLIATTYKATQDLAQAIKSENTMLNTLVSDIQIQVNSTVPAAITAYQTTLTADLSTVTTEAATLQSNSDTLTTAKQNLATAQQNISSATQTNPIDIQTQENVVAQRQATVDQDQNTLDQYFIRAPFDGVVAAVNAVKGAQSGGLGAASGSTAAAVVITNQKVAEVSLNEVDAASTNIGQQATLTFDALPGLTLTGKVVSLDIIGTVSQGVVSYNAKIAFDSQDTRIKPGMSVSAAIITNIQANALEVPIGAVKTQGGQSYVQTVQVPASLNIQGLVNAKSLPAPTNVPVTTGAKNATMIEITSGLNEGDTVIVRTISGATTTSTTGSSANRSGGGPVIFGNGGGNGGGAVRALGR